MSKLQIKCWMVTLQLLRFIAQTCLDILGDLEEGKGSTKMDEGYLVTVEKLMDKTMDDLINEAKKE